MASEVIPGTLRMRANCSHCDGMLIADDESNELVCFCCSRRFQPDGSTTTRPHEQPSRNDERIGGMRF